MSTGSYETLLLERDADVAVLTLHRPDHRNAINAQMADELAAVAQLLAADDALRALVITGSGSFFCVGGDLREIAGKDDQAHLHLKGMADAFHGALSVLARLPAPVIAAVNGVAAGGGLSLVAAADYAVAGEDARFVSAYVRSGLTPDGSLTYQLAKHVGLMRAKEMILMNRMLSAREAEAWGLINRVTRSDTVRQEALNIASSFQADQRFLIAETRRLMMNGYVETLDHQLDDERDTIASMMALSPARRRISSLLAGKS